MKIIALTIIWLSSAFTLVLADPPNRCLPLAGELDKILEDDASKPTVPHSTTATNSGDTVKPDHSSVSADRFPKQKIKPTVVTIAAVPTSEGSFAKIFARRPSSTEVAEVTKLKEALPRGAHVASESGSFSSAVKESKATILLVVGHNEDGKFVFLDGSKQALSEMGDTCRSNGKLCVFVSCESAAQLKGDGVAGLRHEVTFGEAFKIAEEVQTRFQAKAAASLEDLATALPTIVASAERSARVKFHVEYVVKRVGIGVAVVGIILIIDCALDSKKHCIN